MGYFMLSYILLGSIIGLIILLMVYAIVHQMQVYLIASLWFASITMLFFVRIYFPKADHWIHLSRLMPIVLFLVLILKINDLEKGVKWNFRQYCVWLLVALSLIQFAQFVLDFFAEEDYLWLNLLFWIFTAAVFVLALFWVRKQAFKNPSFATFLATFFIPITTFLIAQIALKLGLIQQVYTIGMASLVIQLLLIFLAIFRQFNTTTMEFANLETLTTRENEIVRAYCNGFTYQEISASFFISPNTVKTHLKNVYKKLGVNSKVELLKLINSDIL